MSNDDDEVQEVTAPDGHRAKIKPELDPELRAALQQRDAQSRRRPAFRRQNWFRYQRLGTRWRRPRGIHSKQRRHYKYRPPVVRVGYRGPADVRGLHPSGFAEVMVYNPAELENLDAKVEVVRISGGVGGRKHERIVERADELELRVLNRRGL